MHDLKVKNEKHRQASKIQVTRCPGHEFGVTEHSLRMRVTAECPITKLLASEMQEATHEAFKMQFTAGVEDASSRMLRARVMQVLCA